MKIVQLTCGYSPSGGVASYVMRLSAALAEAGHEVSVIHSQAAAAVPGGNPKLFHVKNFDLYASGDESREKAARVMSVLDSIGPDIVHIQSNNNFFLEENISVHIDRDCSGSILGMRSGLSFTSATQFSYRKRCYHSKKCHTF